MAKRLEMRGEFWLPSDPNSRVPGHLTFSPKDHGTLLLHGKLGDKGTREQGFPRVMGEALGRACVLIDCFEAGSRTAEVAPGGWEEHTNLVVNEVLTMRRADAGSPVDLFSGATARFHGLGEFDGRNPMQRELGSDRRKWTQRVTARDLEPRTVRLPDAQIVFSHGVGSRTVNFVREELSSSWWVGIQPDQPETLDAIIERVSRIRTMIAFAMHQDCRMMEPVTLFPHRGGGPDERPPSDLTDRYELHAVWSRGHRHSYEFYNRVLSFNDLGEEGVRRWLALEDECEHIVSRLASLRYARRIAFEDAILRVVSAADSLHRHVTGEERASAERMLGELALYAGDEFLRYVPALGDWIGAVVDERHRAAHNKGGPVARRLLATELVSSVYWLTFLALLRWADVPAPALSAVAKSQPFLWPMKRVRDTYA